MSDSVRDLIDILGMACLELSDCLSIYEEAQQTKQVGKLKGAKRQLKQIIRVLETVPRPTTPIKVGFCHKCSGRVLYNLRTGEGTCASCGWST